MGSRAWFLTGLFLTTLATLALEILNTRLLSVATWYHLSFFAVSTAMFGMSAGALRVYLGGARYEGAAARDALRRNALAFAFSIPLMHVVNTVVPVPSGMGATTVAALAVTTAALAVPFYLSGVLVAIALTRVPEPPGIVYAVDLLGAAAGCALIVALLGALDVSSAALVCGGLAAAGAACFALFQGRRLPLLATALGVGLIAAGAWNAGSREGLRIAYPKGKPRGVVEAEFWTVHGQVLFKEDKRRRPFYWGAGRGAPKAKHRSIPMVIDGAAGTNLMRWNGSREAIAWVSYDVTSLPYHLRRRGDAAVIGVGGGRDILTAIWAESRSVTGIEINGGIIKALTDTYRDYGKLADRPEVRLVHDEARSYLTRSKEQFDVLQMSLVDTWAATGAGAFTLSENGLYTIDAWHVFLDRLAPRGIFSVSRWYWPDSPSETSRLLALATATLIERGAEDPSQHMMLVARGGVATLLVSRDPFDEVDVTRIEDLARLLDLRTLQLPGRPPEDPVLGRIAASRSLAELEEATDVEIYDFTPPTDERPYFFNILRPTELFTDVSLSDGRGFIARGNLMATQSLVVLWLLSVVGVAGVILFPLIRSGRPSLDAVSFAHAVGFFAAIGLGFMWVQIPLMQRFSVYLGHPIYSVAVILFSMILFAGLGSLTSDRLQLAGRARWLVFGPLAIAGSLLALVAAIQPLIDSTIAEGLAVRCSVVIVAVALVSFPMGFCFPIGLRLVRQLADDATPWMWGVNGACGVLASVSAVGISMWAGINVNLFAAAAMYALLALFAGALWRRAAALPTRA